jgi:hypothetical protein
MLFIVFGRGSVAIDGLTSTKLLLSKEAEERKKEMSAYAILIAKRRINERIQSQGHPTSL